jgi:4-hydroxymandelate oxidase
VDRLVNLAEFEALAAQRLERGAYDYYAGGANDEITVRENRAAFDRISLAYRVLVDVSHRSLATFVLGVEMSMPVILAPTAMHGMADVDGERATARAAAVAGVVMTMSSLASVSIEDVAAAAPAAPKWFQLYVYDDRAKTEQLVKRAYESGFRAIVLTVDVPILGRRERDLRNTFAFPDDVTAVNLVDIGHGHGTPAQVLLQDPSLSWDDLPWLASLAPLPLIVKGIVSADDAARAVAMGAAAVWVSNHGGRQLDTSVPTIDALPGVADAVGGRVPVIVDGGVRRGTDVVKALALGASAVAIGRPQLWGLAVGGEEGVRRVLELLRDELSLAMALCGSRTPAEIDRSLIAVR